MKNITNFLGVGCVALFAMLFTASGAFAQVTYTYVDLDNGTGTDLYFCGTVLIGLHGITAALPGTPSWSGFGGQVGRPRLQHLLTLWHRKYNLAPMRELAKIL